MFKAELRGLSIEALYSGISRAFPAFMEKVQTALPGAVRGPPGDVYVCSPEDHPGPGQPSLMTIFWVPIA